jgi:hypothetical protein
MNNDAGHFLPWSFFLDLTNKFFMEFMFVSVNNLHNSAYPIFSSLFRFEIPQNIWILTIWCHTGDIYTSVETLSCKSLDFVDFCARNHRWTMNWWTEWTDCRLILWEASQILELI